MITWELHGIGDKPKQRLRIRRDGYLLDDWCGNSELSFYVPALRRFGATDDQIIEIALAWWPDILWG